MIKKVTKERIVNIENKRKKKRMMWQVEKVKREINYKIV